MSGMWVASRSPCTAAFWVPIVTLRNGQLAGNSHSSAPSHSLSCFVTLADLVGVGAFGKKTPISGMDAGWPAGVFFSVFCFVLFFYFPAKMKPLLKRGN